MNPTQKARELYDFFYTSVHNYDTDAEGLKNRAKDCCYFMIREIMPQLCGSSACWYWEQVRLEVVKL